MRQSVVYFLSVFIYLLTLCFTSSTYVLFYFCVFERATSTIVYTHNSIRLFVRSFVRINFISFACVCFCAPLPNMWFSCFVYCLILRLGIVADYLFMELIIWDVWRVRNTLANTHSHSLTPLYANSIETNDADEENDRFQFVLLRYCGSRDDSYLSRVHDDGAVTQRNDECGLRLATEITTSS